MTISPGPPAPEAAQQLAGVDEVAVVADRQRPAGPEPEGRLSVLPHGRAGRRIPAMCDRQPSPQARQPPFVQDARHETEILVEHQLLAVTDREAGRLLAPMLEGEEPEGGHRPGLGPGGVPRRGKDGSEHAAHLALLPVGRWSVVGRFLAEDAGKTV